MLLWSFGRIAGATVGNAEKVIDARIKKLGKKDQGFQWDFRGVGFVAGIGLLGAIEQSGHLRLIEVAIFTKIANTQIELVHTADFSLPSNVLFNIAYTESEY